jgi:chromate transporter
MNIALTPGDWQALFTYFFSLSLLAVGGTSTTIPDMQRYLVGERHWMTNTQFVSALGLSRAIPGPNVLLVGLLGWSVGVNCSAHAGLVQWQAGVFGACVTMLGTIVPSAVLTLVVAHWAHGNRHRRSVRSFKAGLAPIVSALLLVAGWLMLILIGSEQATTREMSWLLAGLCVLLAWRTRVHLLWLLGLGALLGAAGVV